MARIEDLEVKVTIEQKRRFGFWTGYICAVSLTCMIQDLMGKEQWLKVASASWTNTPWWGWPILALSVMGVDLWLFEVEKKKFWKAHAEAVRRKEPPPSVW